MRPGFDKLRALDPDMAPDLVARVDAMLAAVEVEHRVTIPLAIESGSRAWGFPSPDSDYDGRFFYVRPLDHYLSPWRRRDVIEIASDGEVDVNGWDLAKALALLVKGNAVVIEWLTSPVVYGGDAAFRADMLALAEAVAPRALIGRHYLRLCQRQRESFRDPESGTPLKKVFYCLRAAAALRWLRLHPRAAVAPMNFPALMAACEPPAAVRAAGDDLLVRKAATRELGVAPMPEVIASFIDGELREAEQNFDTGLVTITDAARTSAEAFFRAAVRRFDPGS